jgi:hypothetical protein
MDVQLHFLFPVYIPLLAVPFCLAWAVWTYRRTLPPLNPGNRIFLTGMRAASLFLVCLVMAGTVIQNRVIRREKPRVALLLDRSRSMTLEDHGVARGDRMLQFLRTGEFGRLRDRVDLEAYGFSMDRGPEVTMPLDSLVMDGLATDIGRTLRETVERSGRIPLSAILLFSDGAHNQGESPLRTAESMSVPVFCVGLGEDVQKTDLLITQVLTNELTYVGNRVPVDVGVRGPGFPGEMIQVRLKSDSGILDARTLSVPADGMEKVVRMHYVPEKPGFQRIVAEIDRLEGEVTSENNQQTLFVRVMKSKLRVLLMASSPGPDLAFVRRLLERDPDIELILRVQKTRDEFYGGEGLTEETLDRADVFLFVDFPPEEIAPSMRERIRRLIVRNQKSLFLIAGRNTDIRFWSSLSTSLPCIFRAGESEHMCVPRLSALGEGHPVLQIHDRIEANRMAWENLPPLLYPALVCIPRPGAETLVMGIPPAEVDGLPQTRDPLLVAFQSAGRKSLVLTGMGLYRWDLLMWGMGRTNDVLKGLLNNALRWLALREETSPVRVQTDKSVYTAGEQIRVGVQVYDEMVRPVASARVTAVLESPTGTFTRELQDLGEGRYGAEMKGYETGEYRLEVQARREGILLGKSDTRFSVSSYIPDLTDTRANPGLMRQLAVITGGRYGPADSLAAVLEGIRFADRESVVQKEWELYRHPLTLVLIVLLLSAEWFIRKRTGLM